MSISWLHRNFTLPIQLYVFVCFLKWYFLELFCECILDYSQLWNSHLRVLPNHMDSRRTHTHTCRHTGIQTRSRKSRNRIKRSEAASLILLICDSFITYSDCNDASDSSVVTSQIPLTWLSSQITLSGRNKKCHVHCTLLVRKDQKVLRLSHDKSQTTSRWMAFSPTCQRESGLSGQFFWLETRNSQIRWWKWIHLEEDFSRFLWHPRQTLSTEKIRHQDNIAEGPPAAWSSRKAVEP